MYICIDLGGTNVRGTWMDDNSGHGRIFLISRPTTLDGTKSALLNLIESIVRDYAPDDPNGSSMKKAKCIGLASAGPLDITRGRFLTLTNMPELNNFEIAAFLEERTGIRVVMENDAQAAAMGEMGHGALTGETDGVVITLGTGVGSGVVINGRIWRGGHFTGPELGHIYMGSGLGLRCGCGQVGCAETWLRKAALETLFRNQGLEFAGLKELDPLIATGDRRPLRALRIYGQRLGIFLSSIQVVFGLPNVCISGGISRLSAHFLKYALKTLEKRLIERKWLLPGKIAVGENPDMSALRGIYSIMRADG